MWEVNLCFDSFSLSEAVESVNCVFAYFCGIYMQFWIVVWWLLWGVTCVYWLSYFLISPLNSWSGDSKICNYVEWNYYVELPMYKRSIKILVNLLFTIIILLVVNIFFILNIGINIPCTYSNFRTISLKKCYSSYSQKLNRYSRADISKS